MYTVIENKWEINSPRRPKPLHNVQSAGLCHTRAGWLCALRSGYSGRVNEGRSQCRLSESWEQRGSSINTGNCVFNATQTWAALSLWNTWTMLGQSLGLTEINWVLPTFYGLDGSGDLPYFGIQVGIYQTGEGTLFPPQRLLEDCSEDTQHARVVQGVHLSIEGHRKVNHIWSSAAQSRVEPSTTV